MLGGASFPMMLSAVFKGKSDRSLMANGRQDKRKEPSLSPPLIRREQESVQGKWAGAAGRESGSRSLLEAEEGEVVATPPGPREDILSE